MVQETAADEPLRMEKQREEGLMNSTVFTAREESTLQSPRVKVADTVGAGDAFSSALIVSLLQGACLREAHEFAVATAAYVCTKEGAKI